MDALLLRDEATRNRIRQAEEFLDPRKAAPPFVFSLSQRCETDCPL